ncbi:MAG: hypothetical protein ABL932_09640 [Terricaulis sp.]
MIRAMLTVFVSVALTGAAFAERPRWEDVREFPTQEQLDAAELLRPVPYVERPDAQDFASVYPVITRGQVGGVTRGGEAMPEGRVTIDCIVQPDYRLACTPSYTAENAVFVRPALMVATKFKVAETTSEGESTLGRRVHMTIRFMAPD